MFLPFGLDRVKNKRFSEIEKTEKNYSKQMDNDRLDKGILSKVLSSYN